MMNCPRLNACIQKLDLLRRALEGWPASLLDLAIRSWMGGIFFSAGLTRIKSWDSQEFLFSDIHPVPFVPGHIAAPMTTAAELVLPVFIVLGLFGRLSALGLLVMTMVIQFIVGATPEGIDNKIANDTHYFWMFLLGVIILHGPGRFSVDHYIMKFRATITQVDTSSARPTNE